jgi:hypothetical protein
VARVDLAGDLERQILAATDGDRERRADAVLAAARATAPVDTGEYRAGLRKERAPGGGWRVAATADHSVIVEYGTRHQDGHRTLLNALEEATE